ncbi:MAG: hypothetical protein KC619_26040 [Myxococcales bacterium]|nr:hypothetical protein [Myxococcales bacterium]
MSLHVSIGELAETLAEPDDEDFVPPTRALFEKLASALEARGLPRFEEPDTLPPDALERGGQLSPQGLAKLSKLVDSWGRYPQLHLVGPESLFVPLDFHEALEVDGYRVGSAQRLLGELEQVSAELGSYVDSLVRHNLDLLLDTARASLEHRSAMLIG